MNNLLKQALIARLTALADDELLLAHRNSEWTGHAPILEEDIAIANIAQDELGHATVFYRLLTDITGDDPDRFVFFRDATDYRNAQLVEYPPGDWAFTMLRQFLFDAYEQVLLAALSESTYTPLAEATAKIRQEELYHLRHSQLWVKRLGLGTSESQQRMQAALIVLWPLHAQLFVPISTDVALQEAGYFPDLVTLHREWNAIVQPHLTQSALRIPDDTPLLNAPRTTHSPHLATLLSDLQQVARLE